MEVFYIHIPPIYLSLTVSCLSKQRTHLLESKDWSILRYAHVFGALKMLITILILHTFPNCLQHVYNVSTLYFTQSDGTVPPPHLMVVPLARYNSTEQKFETPQAISKDKLLPKGHQYCRCDEFHLGKQ